MWRVEERASLGHNISGAGGKEAKRKATSVKRNAMTSRKEKKQQQAMRTLPYTLKKKNQTNQRPVQSTWTKQNQERDAQNERKESAQIITKRVKKWKIFDHHLERGGWERRERISKRRH